MLVLQSVQTSYGPIKALKGIDMEVRKGEIVCLLGSNGAGKTTTLMTISGILHPDAGAITFEGESLTTLSADSIVRKGICQVPEGRRIFQKLTIRGNLEMGAFSDPTSFGGNLETVYALFPILRERADQMGGTLSGGEQQMLAMGRALMARPKVILMDEPSMGLSPIMVQEIAKIIRSFKELGFSVLLIEQNAVLALHLADQAYVLETGSIALQGQARDLLANEHVKKAYLGG